MGLGYSNKNTKFVKYKMQGGNSEKVLWKTAEDKEKEEIQCFP